MLRVTHPVGGAAGEGARQSLCGIVPTGVPERWGMQPFDAATADATAAVSAPLLSTTCPDAEAALNQAGWRLYEEALLHAGGPVFILPCAIPPSIG